MPQPPTTPALSLNNINISIAGKEICHDINLTINPGECHILIGPNGSGKSTLLCAIMGIKPFTITSGTILLDGIDITTSDITDRARAGLGLAFQRPVGLEGVSVRRLAHALGATHRLEAAAHRLINETLARGALDPARHAEIAGLLEKLGAPYRDDYQKWQATPPRIAVRPDTNTETDILRQLENLTPAQRERILQILREKEPR